MSTLNLSPDELLTTTRTVRKRLDLTREVPIPLVRESIEIALQAPSGSNQQSWHWVVVTEPEKRSAIGAVYQQMYKSYVASGQSAAAKFQDDPTRALTQRRIGDSASWLAENIARVPVLVIPCLETEPLREGNQAPIWGSLLPAAWSYCLAARARGLGTAWTTFTLLREAEVAEIVGIPENVRQGAMLPTAYYTGTSFRPAPRGSVDTVLHLNTW